MKNNLEYKIESCPNFRDIGGYACPGGFVVRGKFFRSSSLNRLTPEDMEKVKALAPALVLDFRFRDECVSYPNPLASVKGFDYYNLSLLDGLYSGVSSVLPESMGQLYVEMWDCSGSKLVEGLRLILAERDKRIIFHCTAGKDRTGIFAALLLLTAGVSRRDVIEDYSVSYSLMKDIFAEEIERMGGAEKAPLAFFLSQPENMETLLAHMDKKYGGLEGYLMEQSMTEEEIIALRRILTTLA